MRGFTAGTGCQTKGLIAVCDSGSQWYLLVIRYWHVHNADFMPRATLRTEDCGIGATAI